MQVKVSERKLMYSIVCLVTGTIFLFNASLINLPVRVSEKGIAVLLIAIGFIIVGIRIFKRSVVKR